MAKKKAAEKPAAETIESFKGFDGNMQCRGFQYAIGESYKHDGYVVACGSGFHACEYPLDVFGYYPPAGNRFARVVQSGQTAREAIGDSKIASSEITIKAEISIADLIKAAIDYTFKRAKPVDPDSPASATGYSGAASATGDRGAASATGYRGAASATGYSGAASATGSHSVAIATGFYGKAMAAETGAIVLVNRDEEGAIRHIRASKVGENGIAPNVWYTLGDNGEFQVVV